MSCKRNFIRWQCAEHMHRIEGCRFEMDGGSLDVHFSSYALRMSSYISKSGISGNRTIIRTRHPAIPRHRPPVRQATVASIS